MMDVLVWNRLYGVMKTYCSIAMFLKFLHMHRVPAVVTSSSFIGFWHMCNNLKV
jgi:hypothetical protein